MTSECPHPSRGRRCQMCSIERRFEGIDPDPTPYDCPECGRGTSGKDTLCYRCRGDSE